jgi:hypothetical protein
MSAVHDAPAEVKVSAHASDEDTLYFDLEMPRSTLKALTELAERLKIDKFDVLKYEAAMLKAMVDLEAQGKYLAVVDRDGNVETRIVL